MKSLVKNVLKRDGILNLTYRVLTIIFKFLLSIIIVEKLSVHDLGVYGIFQTTVTLLIYVLGYDFYTYNTRELLDEKKDDIRFCLFNQTVFHALLYLIVLPLSVLLFFYDVVDFEHMVYFYLILVVEHVSQEMYRILITLKKSVIASLSLLLRSGLWILVLYLVWIFELSSEGITDIFVLWFIGGLLSIVIGLWGIGFKVKFEIDIPWIKRGIIIASPFFISTVFYKTLEFSGRFFIDFYWTKEAVGIFTFYSSISNAMFVLVQSTVIIVLSPYLIESSAKGFEAFNKVFINYRKQVLLVTIVGFLIASVAIYPLIIYLDNELLTDNIYIFYLLLIAVAFFCFSYIPHYGLYSFRKDKSLLKAAIIGAIVCVLLNFVLVPKHGVLGAAIAQVLSMASLFIAKQIFFKQVKNELFQKS